MTERRTVVPAAEVRAVLMQYDDLVGAGSGNLEARIEELAGDGVQQELAFPNAVLAEFGNNDCWVAVAVATDEQWVGLREAIGRLDWAMEPAVRTGSDDSKDRGLRAV